MNMTALVTGAHGFVGRHVARALASEGYQVSGLGHGAWTRLEWQAWGIGEWHVADVTLDSLIAYGGGPDVIVHCAGGGSVGFSITHPYQDFQRNVETLVSVLEFARVSAPRTRIVYPSSAGVYGDVHRLPIAEAAPGRPVSPYGVHKRVAEKCCESYGRQFGLSVAVVRLFSVYGAGLRKQLLWDAAQKIRQGRPEFYGTGEEMRDWLHVKDASALLLAAAGKASPSVPIVNGGTGVGATVRDILSELFSCLGYAGTPAFSGVARSGDPAGYVADIAQARQWGWHPLISRQSGLQEFADWIQGGAR